LFGAASSQYLLKSHSNMLFAINFYRPFGSWCTPGDLLDAGLYPRVAVKVNVYW